MAQAVITLGYMCVEGGLQARCLECFLFLLVPSFPGLSYIKLLIGGRISALRRSKKHLSSPAGSVSYMTTMILFRLATCKLRGACARGS